MSFSRERYFSRIRIVSRESLREFLKWDVLREFRNKKKNTGKEEETGGDREEESGGPRPSWRGFQSQESEEGFHDPRQEEEA